MKILGISAYYHDSAAALIVDGDVVAAVQEERFTRLKNDASFPQQAIRYCLETAGLQTDELDAIVFYDKPFLKFERILQTVLETAPRGLPLFLRSMPVWLKEKLFLKSALRKELKALAGKRVNVPLLFSSHHLSHAASAFYASPFQNAAILTIDGVGEWATASVGYGENNQVSLLEELHFPHSLGLLYASFTYFLGFKVNEGEYKVMGLSPYVSAQHEQAEAYYRLIKSQLVTESADGSIRLNPAYFSYTYASRMIPVKKWETLFGIPKRAENAPLGKEHAALAMALQRFTEDTVLAMARHAHEKTGSENLCLAGGVALNCVANGKLQQAGIFKNIYVQPAAGDAGAALGAALAAYHMHFGAERGIRSDYMKEGALGPKYDDARIETALEKHGLSGTALAEPELLEQCAELLSQGLVLGWFNGRMEFGPRALGNRSIIADAAHPGMQKTLNLKIKKRESFRPFAPIMLEEELHRYFDDARPNAYMLFVYRLKDNWRYPRPEGYTGLPFADMLGHAGSPLPSITHVDYSARVQSLAPDSPKRIRKLLQIFKAKTGRGVLINTSFNVKDEPIVCTPEDAIACFLNTEMDILVLENRLIRKA